MAEKKQHSLKYIAKLSGASLSSVSRALDPARSHLVRPELREKIRKYVDRLFIIFPFERDYFPKHGIRPIFEGNPLVDAIEARRASLPSPDEFRRRHALDERPIELRDVPMRGSHRRFGKRRVYLLGNGGA